MWLLDELAKLKDSNRLAIRQREDAVSFKELWNRSEALSAFFLENNVDHKPIVIYGDKEIDFVAVMHAALKTGVAYVPVDISYPVQRLMKIVDQVESDIIVNFSKLEVEINGSAVIDKCAVNDIYSSYADAVSHCDNWVKEDDICYILFTVTARIYEVNLWQSSTKSFRTRFGIYLIDSSLFSVAINGTVQI